uniref:Putative ovule protein n=1 Tax=Solanum chacoense TaxID=4108 RepID=A0A0V0GPV3_SOLCH
MDRVCHIDSIQECHLVVNEVSENRMEFQIPVVINTLDHFSHLPKPRWIELFGTYAGGRYQILVE